MFGAIDSIRVQDLDAVLCLQQQ